MFFNIPSLERETCIAGTTSLKYRIKKLILNFCFPFLVRVSERWRVAASESVQHTPPVGTWIALPKRPPYNPQRKLQTSCLTLARTRASFLSFGPVPFPSCPAVIVQTKFCSILCFSNKGVHSPSHSLSPVKPCSFSRNCRKHITVSEQIYIYRLSHGNLAKL